MRLSPVRFVYWGRCHYYMTHSQTSRGWQVVRVDLSDIPQVMG